MEFLFSLKIKIPPKGIPLLELFEKKMHEEPSADILAKLRASESKSLKGRLLTPSSREQ